MPASRTFHRIHDVLLAFAWLREVPVGWFIAVIDVQRSEYGVRLGRRERIEVAREQRGFICALRCSRRIVSCGEVTADVVDRIAGLCGKNYPVVDVPSPGMNGSVLEKGKVERI